MLRGTTIVHGSNQSEFTNAVNEKLADGWDFVGGMTVVNYSTKSCRASNRFYILMVRPLEDTPIAEPIDGDE